ncbi:hypothetical protein HPB52_016342 [Rhipicephalus sanguineus]|uniref:Nlr family card domain protein n=1 Tax=Rhipicephalus sanguineus TaxID=34632 RepID=A0A9D4SST1_RHISA|nr:hypothetical protein HPB52_016342 [Rhipicephalus sanguineus]
MELREQRGGCLSLVSIEVSDVNLIPRPSPDTYRATPFLRWLLKTHVCITSLQLIDNWAKSHSQVVLQELPENSRVKALTLNFYYDKTAPTHMMTILGRLRSLEILNYFIMGQNAAAHVAGISALLRTTTSLTSLVFSASFDNSPPPKTFIDALAANSTLKSVDLRTYWMNADSPGHLGEYVRSNRLITALSVYGIDVDREEIMLDEVVVRNGTLSSLVVSAVLEGLAQTDSLRRVTFGYYTHGFGANLMHFGVFSSIGIGGKESVQVDALQRLREFDHITRVSIEVAEASELLFSALATYIRETTVLRKLSLTVTSPQCPANTAPPSCWMLLFESMSANTSISDLCILSNGKFRYNNRLARIIGLSRYITKVSFMINRSDKDATEFVCLLSETIRNNYNLVKFDLYGSKVGIEAKRCLFTVRETTRRNSGLVERAAAFNDATCIDRYTATALEKVSRHPGLMRELAEKEGIAVGEVFRMIGSRLRSIEGLHDFMRLTGVVKECVTCAPPVDGFSMQLQDLNNDCWRLLRRYLSFDDVESFTITDPDHPTLRI